MVKGTPKGLGIHHAVGAVAPHYPACPLAIQDLFQQDAARPFPGFHNNGLLLLLPCLFHGLVQHAE